jgi:glycine betaine/choline ABC-type transport system substrate-binding protein
MVKMRYESLGRTRIIMTRSLGFSDNYAIDEEGNCKKLHINKISDLRKHPNSGSIQQRIYGSS